MPIAIWNKKTEWITSPDRPRPANPSGRVPMKGHGAPTKKLENELSPGSEYTSSAAPELVLGPRPRPVKRPKLREDGAPPKEKHGVAARTGLKEEGEDDIEEYEAIESSTPHRSASKRTRIAGTIYNTKQSQTDVLVSMSFVDVASSKSPSKSQGSSERVYHEVPDSSSGDESSDTDDESSPSGLEAPSAAGHQSSRSPVAIKYRHWQYFQHTSGESSAILDGFLALPFAYDEPAQFAKCCESYSAEVPIVPTSKEANAELEKIFEAYPAWRGEARRRQKAVRVLRKYEAKRKRTGTEKDHLDADVQKMLDTKLIKATAQDVYSRPADFAKYRIPFRNDEAQRLWFKRESPIPKKGKGAKPLPMPNIDSDESDWDNRDDWNEGEKAPFLCGVTARDLPPHVYCSLATYLSPVEDVARCVFESVARTMPGGCTTMTISGERRRVMHALPTYPDAFYLLIGRELWGDDAVVINGNGAMALATQPSTCPFPEIPGVIITPSNPMPSDRAMFYRASCRTAVYTIVNSLRRADTDKFARVVKLDKRVRTEFGDLIDLIAAQNGMIDLATISKNIAAISRLSDEYRSENVDPSPLFSDLKKSFSARARVLREEAEAIAEATKNL